MKPLSHGQLVRPPNRRAECQTPRVAPRERLGEEDQLGSLPSGFGGGAADVADGGDGVEGIAAGLDGCNADAGAMGHWRGRR